MEKTLQSRPCKASASWAWSVALIGALSGTLSGIFVSQLFRQDSAAQTLPGQVRKSSIGQEVSVPVDLQDGQEFTISLEALSKQGKLLFNANWTEQEGGGRPLTKGTGRPLSDPSRH